MYAFLGISRTCITGETAKPAEAVNEQDERLFFSILPHLVQHIQSDFGRLTAGCIFFILNLNGEERHMAVLADKSCKPDVYKRQDAGSPDYPANDDLLSQAGKY